jgi:hypothetical protein
LGNADSLTSVLVVVEAERLRSSLNLDTALSYENNQQVKSDTMVKTLLTVLTAFCISSSVTPWTMLQQFCSKGASG